MKTNADEKIVRLHLGFEPDSCVSGAILLQSESSTFLVFNAVRVPEDDSRREARIRAVCEFDTCFLTKFGYPNDEAYYSIPRTKGLGYDLFEVEGSLWKQETAELNEYAFPGSAHFFAKLRHFLFLFHDSSFECLANDISAELSIEALTSILARVSDRLAAD